MVESANPYPVESVGFFFGSLAACLLYGIHLSQIYSFFDQSQYTAPRWNRILAVWVLGVSSVHMMVVWSSLYKYFVAGVNDPSIWGELWWPLSVQDGIVAVMAATAQAYFGHRAWLLSSRNRWIRLYVICMTLLILSFGIILAITARLWADNPWVSEEEMMQRPMAAISQAAAIVWMSLSAVLDASLTAILVWKFSKAKQSTVWTTRQIASRLISLTLETVLLTHLVGAVMCILFLSAPAAHRTKNDLFWFLLEIITELYALSILFTIISQENVRQKMIGHAHDTVESDTKVVPDPIHLGQTELDRRVEGWMGTAFAEGNSIEAFPGSSQDPFNGMSSGASTPGIFPHTPIEMIPVQSSHGWEYHNGRK